MVLTLLFTIKFPMKKKDKEQQICERVTGYKYEDLWKKENALKF